MKNRHLAFILILPLLLAACGSKQEDSSAIQPSIYTAVAQTLTANPTRTVESEPTEAPTATQTNTATVFPTVFVTQSYNVTYQDSCNQATYLSDETIPDNTVLSAGKSFKKTWKIKNTGTCTWSTSYSVRFVSGTQMSGATTYLSASVAPNSSVDVSVDLVAPSTAGTYSGYWQMADETGTIFASSFYLTIVIPSSTTTVTITATPTVTATPTQTPIYIVVTATPMPTGTPIPADTTVPSQTPTPTEVPTSETGG